METSNRFPAFIGYLLPVVGWLYILAFQRKNPLAVFHLRQAVGLFLFLAAAFLAWVVVGWVLAWVPFGMNLVVALFTLVITALVYGVVAWITGMVNALRGRMTFLPVFGRMANRIPL